MVVSPCFLLYSPYGDLFEPVGSSLRFAEGDLLFGLAQKEGKNARQGLCP